MTRYIERLRNRLPDVSAAWIRDSRFHLTLKFLGQIPRDSVNVLSRTASRAVAGVSPFKIIIEKTGVFPKKGPSRVLWIGVTDPAGELSKLYIRLDLECAEAGFEKEQRPFHPHITLARMRNQQGSRRLATAHHELDFEPAEVTATELLVIRSELSSEGSKYTLVSRHHLAAPA